MIEQVCPVCGCTVVEDGFEKEEVKYCCEPCTTGSASCECGCCNPAEEGEDLQSPWHTLRPRILGGELS